MAQQQRQQQDTRGQLQREPPLRGAGQRRSVLAQNVGAGDAVVQRLVARRQRRHRMADVETEPRQRTRRLAKRGAREVQTLPVVVDDPEPEPPLARRRLPAAGFEHGEIRQRQQRERERGLPREAAERPCECAGGGVQRGIGQPVLQQRQRWCRRLRADSHALGHDPGQRVERIGGRAQAGAERPVQQRDDEQAEQGGVQRPGRIAAQQRDGRHSPGRVAPDLGASRRAAMMPASYSRHIGIASISCETTSGGVITAASTNTPTTA